MIAIYIVVNKLDKGLAIAFEFGLAYAAYIKQGVARSGEFTRHIH